MTIDERYRRLVWGRAGFDSRFDDGRKEAYFRALAFWARYDRMNGAGS